MNFIINLSKILNILIKLQKIITLYSAQSLLRDVRNNVIPTCHRRAKGGVLRLEIGEQKISRNKIITDDYFKGKLDRYIRREIVYRTLIPHTR